MELQKIQNSTDLLGLSDKHIVTIAKENYKAVELNLTALLVEVCSIFKIDDNKSLTDEEIKETVQILIKDYYYLKMADFI